MGVRAGLPRVRYGATHLHRLWSWLLSKSALPGEDRALAGLVALAVVIVAFWRLLHFISAALRFDSLMRAFGLLVAVIAGLFLGLMLILTLMGVSAGGLSNV